MKCSDHINDEHKRQLGYLEWHHAAQLSMAKGERQTKCADCQRFYFPWERTVTSTLTKRSDPRKGDAQ